jgi:hypothetical protein
MVARENHNGVPIVPHHLSRPFQQFERLAVIVERVPRQQDNVGPRSRRGRQNLGKHCKGVGITEAIVYTKMQIRTVNDN